MTQVPLFVLLHLFGLVVVFAWGPRRRPALCCALAFVVGVASATFLSLGLLMLGVYSLWPLVGVVTAVAVFAVAAIYKRGGRPSRRALVLAGIWTVVLSILAVGFSHDNFALTSSDSHYIVLMSGVLGRDGAFEPETIPLLRRWGIFMVVAHSWSMFTLQDWLYAIEPMLGFSFAPVFGLMLWHAIVRVHGQAVENRRRVVMLIVLVTVALFTCFMFAHHLFHIHQNLGTGIYMFVFVTFVWLAEVSDDTSLLPIAFLSLTAAALHRPETPLLLVLATVPTVLVSKLPRSRVTPLFAATVAIVVGWFAFIIPFLPAEANAMTQSRAAIAAAPWVAVFVWWLLVGQRFALVRKVNQHAPSIALGAVVLIAAAMFATKTEHMLESVDAEVTNLLREESLWGFAWYIIPAAALVAFFTPAPPRHRIITFTIWLSLGFFLIVVYARPPYRVGIYDSANRMMIHVLPLMLFYLGIKSARSVFQPA